jgi:hypothetical protein
MNDALPYRAMAYNNAWANHRLPITPTTTLSGSLSDRFSGVETSYAAELDSGCASEASLAQTPLWCVPLDAGDLVLPSRHRSDHTVSAAWSIWLWAGGNIGSDNSIFRHQKCR